MKEYVLFLALGVLIANWLILPLLKLFSFKKAFFIGILAAIIVLILGTIYLK